MKQRGFIMGMVICLLVNACSSGTISQNTQQSTKAVSEQLENTAQPADIKIPTPQPTSLPMPSIPALRMAGFDGKRVESICLEVVQNNYDRSVDVITEELLRKLGFHVFSTGGKCDAALSILMNFSPRAAWYSGGSINCQSYHGASMNGSVAFTLLGVDPYLISISQNQDLPDKISTCLESPNQAPFENVWTGELIDAFTEIWGPVVLVESLDSKRIDLSAVNRLRQLKEKYSEDMVLRLIAKLSNPEDPDTRQYAVEFLGEVDEEFASMAITALLPLLEDEEPAVRDEVIRSITRLDPEISATAMLPQLLELLQDEDEFSVGNAAEAIGNLGAAGEEAIPDLIALLEQDRLFFPSVITQVILALGKMGPAAEDAVPVLQVILAESGSTEPELEKKEAAATALGMIGGQSIVTSEVVESIFTPDHDVQMRVMQSLAKQGPLAADAVPELIVFIYNGTDGLSHSNNPSELIEQAVRTLGSIGPAAVDAVPVLYLVLDDPLVEPIHPVVLEALYRIGDRNVQDTINMLIPYLENGTFWLTQVNAMFSIAHLEPESASVAVPALIDLLQSFGNTFEGSVVVHTLGDIGPLAAKAIPNILEILRDDSHGDNWVGIFESIAALGKMGEKAMIAIPDIVPFLSVPNANLNDEALKALVAISGEDFGSDADAWIAWYENLGTLE